MSVIVFRVPAASLPLPGKSISILILRARDSRRRRSRPIFFLPRKSASVLRRASGTSRRRRRRGVVPPESGEYPGGNGQFRAAGRSCALIISEAEKEQGARRGKSREERRP